MKQKQDEALLDYAWLDTEKLEFNLLVMASVLAMDKKAFLGTLEDVTNYLGIANNRKNKANIKQALSNLSRQGFIIQVNDKANIIIALSYNAKNNSKVIRIQKAWIEVIRNYRRQFNSSVAWDTVLRVFLFLLGNCGKGINKLGEIASSLDISPATVSNAVKVLCNIDFGNIAIEKEVVRDRITIDGNVIYHCLGTQFSVMQIFDTNLDE